MNDIRIKNKNAFYDFFESISFKLYNLMLKIPILKDFIYNFKNNLKLRFLMDEKMILVEIIKVISLISFSFVISFISLAFYFKNILLSIFSSIIITKSIYDLKYQMDVKFLEGLEEVLSDFVHYYNMTESNLDKTFLKLEETTYNDNFIKKHFLKLFDYVKEASLSDDDSFILQEYSENAINKYFKILCNFIYTTYKYGDEIIDNKSAFVEGLLSLQREVNNELEKKLIIREETFLEVVFIVMPLYFLPLIKSYMLNYFSFEGFSYIRDFIFSNIGYSVMIFCAILTFVFYIFYKNLCLADDVIIRKKAVFFEEKILKRFKFLDKLVEFLIKDKVQSINNLLLKSAKIDNAKFYYLRKVLVFFISFMILISIFTFNIFFNKLNVISSLDIGVNKNLLTRSILLHENIEAYKDEALENDKKIINYLRANKEFVSKSKDEQEDYIRKYMKKNNISYGINEVGIDRIFAKLEIISINRFSFLRLLFIIFVCFILCNIEYFILKSKAFINKEHILYDETMGLYTVCILLLNNKHITPKDLLNNMKNFSYLFKMDLQKALDNYSLESLKDLKKITNYKYFNNLIDAFLISEEGLEIKKAFCGLKQKKDFQEKSRERSTRKFINRNIEIIRFLSMFSLFTTIILYIFAPLLIAVMDMFSKTNSYL